MTRLTGTSLLFTLLAATAACGVGGGGGDDDDDGGIDTKPLPDLNNKEVCNAQLKVAGTFTAGTPARPNDPDTGTPLQGCWPVGTWTFTASVASNTCTAAPALQSSYSFKVEMVTPDEGGDDLIQRISSTAAQATGMQYHLKVSSNAQGCAGGLELGSADGKQYWNLQPTLADGATTLSGAGDYIVYEGDGWPWKNN